MITYKVYYLKGRHEYTLDTNSFETYKNVCLRLINEGVAFRTEIKQK